jgi:hypothetical protein
MKIVVIGGTGLIGSKLIRKTESQRLRGCRCCAEHGGQQPSLGRDCRRFSKTPLSSSTFRNSPSFEEKAVMEFFKTSTRNLLSYGAKAGMKHHVALSVVGTDRLEESAYIAREDRARKAHQGVRDTLDVESTWSRYEETTSRMSGLLALAAARYAHGVA